VQIHPAYKTHFHRLITTSFLFCTKQRWLNVCTHVNRNGNWNSSISLFKRNFWEQTHNESSWFWFSSWYHFESFHLENRLQYLDTSSSTFIYVSQKRMLNPDVPAGRQRFCPQRGEQQHPRIRTFVSWYPSQSRARCSPCIHIYVFMYKM